MPKQSVCERIAYSKPRCPVYVCRWLHRMGFQGSLAHHRDIEFQLIKRGRGFYLIDGKRIPFARNSLLCIHPGQIHRLSSEPGITLERLSMIFRSDWSKLGRVSLGRLETIPQRLLLTVTETVGIDLAMRRIETELQEQASTWEEMVRLLLREFLLLTDRARQRQNAIPSIVPQHAVLPAVVSFIDAHFAENLSVEAIARHAGFSPSHLSHLFKRHTGLGIKQYVLHRRVLEAKRWLEEAPELSVTAISEKVGFGDFSLFNRAFKAILFTTPSEYRAIAARQRHPRPPGLRIRPATEGGAVIARREAGRT